MEKTSCTISKGIRIYCLFYIAQKKRKCFSVTMVFLDASYIDGAHAYIYTIYIRMYTSDIKEKNIRVTSIVYELLNVRK